MSVEKALAHYTEHRNDHLKDLMHLVRIPSVSFDGFPPQEVVRSAEAVAQLLTTRGLQNVSILTLEGAHPYVYGDWCKAPGKPTVLLYAHHDVQPPGDLSIWKTKPFEPALIDGRLYGRGAADDKAGVVANTAAIASWLQGAGTLPVNVKVIVEGEEEVGSDHLHEFLSRHKERLQADIMVLSDAGNFDTGLPSLTVSLRGLVVVEAEVRSLRNSVHSGMWGGPVPDPAAGLAKALATLHDAEGRIAIPGIYDRIRPLTPEERKDYDRLEVTEPLFRRQIGMLDSAKLLNRGKNPYEVIWREPSLTVNAIQASTKEQARNIICDSAWARVGIRIVPDMDPVEVRDALTAHLKRHTPWGLEMTVRPLVCDTWWMTDPTGPVFDKARRAFTAGYGRETVFIGCGGSIPFVGPFATALGGAPALLIGVEDPYTNAHGENESLSLADLDGAVRGLIHLFGLLGE